MLLCWSLYKPWLTWNVVVLRAVGLLFHGIENFGRQRNRLKDSASTCAICIPVFFLSILLKFALDLFYFAQWIQSVSLKWLGFKWRESSSWCSETKQKMLCRESTSIRKCSERSLLRNDPGILLRSQDRFSFLGLPRVQILGHAFNPVLLYCGTFRLLSASGHFLF